MRETVFPRGGYWTRTPGGQTELVALPAANLAPQPHLQHSSVPQEYPKGRNIGSKIRPRSLRSRDLCDPLDVLHSHSSANNYL